MAESTVKAAFPKDIETVWNTVTNLENYSWRSDLKEIKVKDETHFTEYTKDGFATNFIVTAKEPCKCWEFDMENENMKGHWTGIFTRENGQTKIDFTESVTAKKLFMKPFVKSYLKKQQAQYINDLKKALS